MRVRLRDNGQRVPYGLAPGSEYEVLQSDDDNYFVEDYWGTTAGYLKSRFEIVPEEADSNEPQIGDGLFDETTHMYEDTSGGSKGSKIARYDMIPAEALAEVAVAYGRGELKYPADADGRQNWEKGYPYRYSFGAMMRHAWRFWRGEDYDPETGVHHLALVVWHCFTMMTFQARGIGTDDRPAKRG